MINPDHFRERIELRLNELMSTSEQAAGSTEAVELDQTRVGRLSRMDAMQMQQMELALSRRQQRELAALRQALKRIEDNTYGECFECGEQIDPRRLEIDLAATLCISCAALKEA